MARVQITIAPGGYEVIVHQENGSALLVECRDFSDKMDPDEVARVLADKAVGVCRDMNRDPEWRYQRGSKTQSAHVYRCGFPDSRPLCGTKNYAGPQKSTTRLADSKKKAYGTDKCPDCAKMLTDLLVVHDDEGFEDEAE